MKIKLILRITDAKRESHVFSLQADNKEDVLSVFRSMISPYEFDAECISGIEDYIRDCIEELI